MRRGRQEKKRESGDGPFGRASLPQEPEREVGNGDRGEDDPDTGEDNDAEEELPRAHEISRGENQKVHALVGGNHLRGHHEKAGDAGPELDLLGG